MARNGNQISLIFSCQVSLNIRFSVYVIFIVTWTHILLINKNLVIVQWFILSFNLKWIDNNCYYFLVYPRKM